MPGLGGACEPPKQYQVPDKLDELGTAIDGLSERLATLESRLSPVMRKDQPAEVAKGMPENNPLVEVADIIEARRRSVSGITGRINTILETLEV